MPATVGGCNTFALTSWLQHDLPDGIFHKSAGTDVLEGLSPLWRIRFCGAGRGLRARPVKKTVMRAKLKALPS